MRSSSRVIQTVSFLFLFLIAIFMFAGNVPSLPQSSAPPGRFVDATSKLGIHFRQQASPTSKKYLLETMGSGVAVFDYDNDGRLDIFFANGAPLTDPTPKGTIPKKDGPKYWNRLYHQKPDGTFEDVTERAGLAGIGYSTGVAVGDYDNDGYEDLYVAGYGHGTLYHNNGDGTFTDVTAQAGVGGSGWMTSAAWVDYDNDGRLDLAVARYMQWDFDDIYCGHREEGFRSYCHPDIFKPESMLLFHNDGNGKFTEVSHQAGIDKPAKGLGLAIADYDHDGWPDIFLANDSIPEYVFHNLGNGKFEEVGLPSGAALDGNGTSFAGMGVDFADYNNDGWPDIIITDLANQRYALYTNLKDGSFDYSTSVTGLGAISLLHSGWGVRFFDYDNDGWKDLLIAQSHVMDTIQVNEPNLRYREPPLLLHNEAGKKFTDVSAESGEIFHEQWAARGLAIGDLNNEGKIDAVVTSNDGPAWVLLNETPTSNHWITLKLVGVKSNRDAIGAEVKIATAAGDQFATVTTSGSYESSSDKRVHFGLGRDDAVREIDIRWPSGIRQEIKDVKADQILTVTESSK
ncbi:MAG TPA: CRTAC1 family protein [Terriglobales bacterium]|nr:CRTAC1 family protein [Terriglobales bacterium]